MLFTVFQLIFFPVLLHFKISNNIFYKIIINFLVLIITIILITQISCLLISNNFLSTLTLFNLKEGSALGTKGLILLILSFLIVITSLIAGNFFYKNFNKKIITIFSILIIISLPLDKTPTYSFYKTIKSYFKLKNSSKLEKKDLENINNKITKNFIVKNSDSKKFIDVENKTNVIVIFIEGMSYDIISKNITPNIYNYMQKSINVNNYYNHTAATFRGLRGQLTSSYQLTGGYYNNQTGIGQMDKKSINRKYKNSNVFSIAQILNQYGYDSYFQTPLSKDSALNSIFEPMGFKKSFGYEDHKNLNIIKNESMSDKNTYELLFNNIQKLDQPFFYGVYNRDTHLGMDSRDIKFKDGKNSYLNQFHNMDYWFGNFIKKFNESSISNNTILVFTADHATYPSKEFLKTFNVKNDYFFDKIPFFIYKKGLTPKIFDAKGKNSLSLAPTILDILGIHNVNNKFLGSSLFEVEYNPIENYIYAEGDQYLTSQNNEIQLIDDKSLKDKIFLLQKFGDN